MNPAALKANIGDLTKGASDHRRHPRLHRPQPRPRPATPTNPLEDGSLAEYAVHALDLTGMTVEAVKEFGLSRKDAARAKNMFALGLLSWMYGRPIEATIAFLEKRFAKVPDIRDANIAAFKAGLELRRDHRGVRGAVRGQAAPMPAGTYRNITGNLALAYGLVAGGRAVRPAAVPRLLPDHPGLRHPARAVQAQAVRRDDVPGRGRDRRRRRRARCGVRRRARRDHHVRSRPRAEGRDDRSGGDARAAAAGRRRPARRPVDRPAHQDRAGRPAAGDVRPQRRVAGADRRAAVARRLLRRRARGGPDRGHLPHAGDAAVRRLPRQRLRAVADPRRRRAARDRPDFATEPNHSGDGRRRAAEFRPYLRDPETLARPWAVPGTAGLEHRIGGLEKADGTATSPTTRPTTTSWSAPGRPRSTGSPTRSRRSRSTTPTARAKVLVLGWGSTYGPIGAGVRRVRKAGYHVAQAHLRHLNPFPDDLGEVLRRYDG